MDTKTIPATLRIAALALACSFAAPCLQAADAVADSRGVHFSPSAAAPGYQLRITGPAGYLFEQVFVDGDEMKASPAAGGWTDGTYRYEITPVMGMGKRAEGDAGGLSSLSGAPQPTARSGAFVVVDGVVFTDNGEVERAYGVAKNALVDQDAGITPRDQVIPDDLIVQGSICVGFDCVNNESFGFDTVRLKENNTRIKFEDTSASAGFPSTDWQLTANDSASGGLNKFSIEDVTAARVPFTVEGNAATNSIYVDDTGRVGFRTSTPVLDLHVATSNTPGMRLEQNNSGGFTAQTWDIAGNEANFFVRDVTGGSRLPFRIRPGAPTSSIDISAAGLVGVGTASPAAKLHVTAADGAQLLVNDTAGTVAGRDLMRLENNGPTRFRMLNTATGLEWSFNAHNADFRLTPSGAATPAFTLFPNGNLTISGTLTQSSDRNSKTGFAELDHKALLAKVAALDITEWSFLAEPDGVRHIGPMAQDFHALFGLGEREDRIAPLDTSGVALAAVQGLQKELAERDARIAELTARVEALTEQGRRVEQLAQQMDQLLQPVSFADVGCEASPRASEL